MSFELILPFLRPIEALLLDDSISEIMGNPDASWWYERDGIIRQEATVSFHAGQLRTGLEVIANQLGKKLDEDNPLLHAQLPDGSRLAAVIPPVVRPAPALTIRKFTSRHYTIDDLIARGTLTRPLADFLGEQIRSGKTLLISGGTGTGKTTLLRILADFIPDHDRIVVIEDTSELHIQKPNIVPTECQTDTFKANISFDDLLKSALRWRPDRIILGEVRGIEARTLLDSFNTGHAGSLATIHANSAEKALRRFANLVMRGGAGRRIPLPATVRGRVLRGMADLSGMQLQDLPQTREEVEEIGKIVGPEAVILLGKDATETAFKKEPLDQFRVLHLAVHGFADKQYPERSALVLGTDPKSGDDGLLQVREIIRLRLNAELTTLSACDTGVGKLQGQEGVSSLVEAFLVAGSKSVVASLWSADDTFASALMNRFYLRLGRGEDTGSALRDAKLDLLAKYGEQVSPFYWAAFVAVGETSTPIGIKQQ
jgi:pilus assembly protein CpaF